jgi:3-oxoacyl-[acyl-carrier protein] reductase
LPSTAFEPASRDSLARLICTYLLTDLSKKEIPVNENRGLTGTIAIVFGGSRGIGAAAARRLAKEGADVAVTYVSTPERAADTVAAIEATGRTGLAIKADSADPAAIKAAVEQTVNHFGKLDIAVVNAGILLLGDVATVNVDDLDRMLNINVRGVFLAIQAAAARLTNGGRIITIGSNTAVRSGHPGSSVYSMTKAAVAVMVKGIAIDLASRGITVNNIQPGPTVTDMTVDHIEAIKPLIPLKRAGDPGEIAGLIAYLARKESGYMTGSSLTIDGGMAL